MIPLYPLSLPALSLPYVFPNYSFTAFYDHYSHQPLDSMSSFRRTHQPFFDVISIFGTAPISKNLHGKFHQSTLKCVYSVLLTICLMAYFLHIVITQLIALFKIRESNGITLFISYSIHQVCMIISFAYIMFDSIRVARSHSDLLNLMVDLEHSVDDYRVRFSCTLDQPKTCWTESNWTAVALVAWINVVNLFTSLTYDQVDVLFLWIDSMQFCLVLYVRLLTILLTRTCGQMRRCFAHSQRAMLASDLVVLDQVANVKDGLMHTFGGVMLMNFFSDLITVLVTAFWVIFTVAHDDSTSHFLDMAFVLSGYTIPFVIKVYLVTNTMEGYATEVSSVCVNVYYKLFALIQGDP